MARSAISTSCAGRSAGPPARQNLIPLYSPGLWLAVNIAPGRPSRPEANHSSSVLASPMSTTSAPRLSTPSMKAADISRAAEPHVTADHQGALGGGQVQRVDQRGPDRVRARGVPLRVGYPR